MTRMKNACALLLVGALAAVCAVGCASSSDDGDAAADEDNLTNAAEVDLSNYSPGSIEASRDFGRIFMKGGVDGPNSRRSAAIRWDAATRASTITLKLGPGDVNDRPERAMTTKERTTLARAIDAYLEGHPTANQAYAELRKDLDESAPPPLPATEVDLGKYSPGSIEASADFARIFMKGGVDGPNSPRSASIRYDARANEAFMTLRLGSGDANERPERLMSSNERKSLAHALDAFVTANPRANVAYAELLERLL